MRALKNRIFSPLICIRTVFCIQFRFQCNFRFLLCDFTPMSGTILRKRNFIFYPWMSVGTNCWKSRIKIETILPIRTDPVHTLFRIWQTRNLFQKEYFNNVVILTRLVYSIYLNLFQRVNLKITRTTMI